MFDKQDLRGIVTLSILAIFFLCIFAPITIQVWTGEKVGIPEAFTQSIIALVTMVVGFYFADKAKNK